MFSRHSKTKTIELLQVLLLALIVSSTAIAELIYTADPATTISGDMLIPAEQGDIRGTNLFHSFDTFNVQTGESATFSGPDLIANVIARVTGPSGTLIDGLLKSTINQADLFLINSNGIVFGKQATLDVDGNLYFSTADNLSFNDGSILFMSASGNSVLTSAAPSAFGFLSADTAPITLEGAVLSNLQGTGVSLTGGDITLHNASIYIPDGSVDIVSVQDIVDIPVLTSARTPEAYGALGQVQVMNEGAGEAEKIVQMIQRYGKRVADLDVTGPSGGRIDLIADTFSMATGFMFADTELAGKGQGINLYTDTLLSLSAFSRITTASLGDGDAGDIQLTAGDTLRLTGSATIAADAQGNLGNGGKIFVSVTDLVVESLAQIKTTSNSPGDAGAIIINAATVSLLTGGSIAGQTIGQGRGGDIQVSASEFVILDGVDVVKNLDSGVSVTTLGAGDGGSISIATPSLTLRNGASIKAFSGGQSEVTGAAGSIEIQTGALEIGADSSIDANSYSTADAGSIKLITDDLLLFGVGAQISSQAIGAGMGGAIEIQTDNLRINDSGELTVSTLSSGDAGEISISASSVAIVDGIIEASTSGSGKGGEITIFASDLEISQGGIVNTGTSGTGNAGTLNVNVSTALLITGAGSSISSRSGLGRNGRYGEGGSIRLRANTINIDRNAVIEATSSGTGFAGNLEIFTETDLYLENEAALRTDATNSGGGSITIEAANYVVLNDSTVTASAGGEDAGDNSGNVNIDPIFLILKNSSILAQANFGDGGAIFLSAENFIRDINSVLDASSQRGNDGEITIASPDTSITGVLGVLNTGFISQRTLLRTPCAARAFDDKSSLIVIPGSIQSNSTPDYHGHDAPASIRQESCIRF